MLYDGNSNIRTVEAANYSLEPGEKILDNFVTEVLENIKTQELGMVDGNSTVFEVRGVCLVSKVFYVIGKKKLSVVD